MLAPIALVAVGLVFSPAPQRSFSTVAVRPRRASGIVCGWGPDPVWSALTIASIADAGTGLKAITGEERSPPSALALLELTLARALCLHRTVDAPDATVEGYTKGGQYVQLRAPGAEKVRPTSVPRRAAPSSPTAVSPPNHRTTSIV